MRFISNGIPINPVSIPSLFPLHLLFLFLPFLCFALGHIFMCCLMFTATNIFNPPFDLFWKLVILLIASLECHIFSCYMLSGTSANEIVMFNGKSDVVEFLSLSPYSFCTSNCIPAIFHMVVHSN